MYEDYFYSSTLPTLTVLEKDEIQLTKVLGPDGQPYAIRRPKAIVGFDLSRNKS
jgi:hypothetical protein